MFVQDAVPVKAGNRAPEIDWNKIVQWPESTKYQPSLTGQLKQTRDTRPSTSGG